mgnify:CR=1 FL=1
MLITQEDINSYRDKGFFFLEGVMSDEQVKGIRAECDQHVEQVERDIEEGRSKSNITHYKSRYFISSRGHENPHSFALMFSDLMADIARATLGETAYLFNEQFVVKAPRVGGKFAWHQDSGYIGHYHQPYLSCWCALDDMSEENGTVYVLPFDRAGMKPDDLFDHEREVGSNDKVGYSGEDPGVPAIVPAGSIVVFSSRTFHRSGPNITDQPRRSYLTQYSAEQIMNKDGSDLWGQAVPFLKDGKRMEVTQTERYWSERLKAKSLT